MCPWAAPCYKNSSPLRGYREEGFFDPPSRLVASMADTAGKKLTKNVSMNKTPLHITIITVFPELHQNWLSTSLLARAQEEGRLSFSTLKFSDFVEPKERIDTPACGPGAGMVIKAPVASAAIEQAQKEHGKGTVVFFSPSGEQLTQRVLGRIVGDLGNGCRFKPGTTSPEVTLSMQGTSSRTPIRDSQSNHLILVCGRYEGIDHRVEQQYADHVICLGPYVLMGGDVAAQVFLEGLLRLVPGVVGRSESVENDSFTGALLDHPAYGQPKVWSDKAVPEVLLSGDHARIAQWREERAIDQTLLTHFEWLRRGAMDTDGRVKIAQHIPAHYAILMHDQVLIGKKELKPGTTSVTTIDLHDIARSCATYGIKKFFVVTPLHDQQKLLRVFFQFWHTAQGKEYNHTRHDAMSRVHVVSSIEEAEQMIMDDHNGVQPLRVATSAKPSQSVPPLTYDDQGVVWQRQRPVSLIFGTGQGLTNTMLASCDYLLTPVRGFSTYNHLSVRSAVAIIFDRWLGYYQPVEKDKSA